MSISSALFFSFSIAKGDRAGGLFVLSFVIEFVRLALENDNVPCLRGALPFLEVEFFAEAIFEVMVQIQGCNYGVN